MEETLMIEQQAPMQEDPPLKKLWKGLNADKKYTKSFDEFKVQYSNPESVTKLYQRLSEDGDYTKSIQDFQQQYFPEVKKKDIGASNSGSVGQLPSQEKKTGNSVIIGDVENAPADPIQIAKEADELSKRKVPSEVMNELGRQGEIPDEVSISLSKEKLKQLEGIGYNEKDAKKLATDFADFPEQVLNTPGYTKEELLDQFKNNRQKYERSVGAAKGQSHLFEQINNANKNGNISNDEAETLSHNIASGINIINNTEDYQLRRENIKRVMDIANQYGGEKRNDILRNLGTDFGYVYGKEAVNPDFINSNASSKLNNLQAAAKQYLEDIHPEELRKYSAAFIDDEAIKDNDSAKLAKEEANKRLEEIGIGLSKSYLEEKLSPIKKEYESLLNKSTSVGLTPEETQRAQQLELDGGEYQAQLQNVNEDERTLGEKYPTTTAYEARNFAQELIGSKNNWLVQWLDHAALKTGEATENTAKGVYDFVAEPFRSEEGSRLRQYEILGEGVKNRASTYVSGIGGKSELSPELKEEVEKIKSDDSLSYDQKYKAVTDLLIKRNGEWGTNNKESNGNLKSLAYGITDLAAGLVPFMAAEIVTGGGATAGFARKFASTFVSATATSFEDSYRNALERGEKNPYAYATRVTAINAAAIAGAGTPDKIRAIFSKQNTPIANLIKGMSDDGIKAILKETPNAFKNFKTTLNAIKEKSASAAKGTFSSFKDAAKINAFMSGGQIANDAISGELRKPEDYVKDFAIETLKFGLMSTIGKAATKIVKPTDMGLHSLYEAATNKDALLTHLDQQIKDGIIEPDKASEVRKNIEDVAKIYKKNEEVIGVLFDKQKREYLYNALMEERNSKMAKSLPEKQAEKYEIEAEVAKHKNALLLEPKTDTQLEKRKVQLEKELIPKTDSEGKKIEIPEKEIIAAKAEIKAIDEVLEENKKSAAVVEPPKEIPKNIEIGEQSEISKANENGVSVEAPTKIPEPIQLNEVGQEVSPTENKPTTQIEEAKPDAVQIVKDNADGVKNLIYKDVLKNGDAETVKEVLKEVSGQWHDEGTRKQTERDFGLPIVEAAKEMFPQESHKGIEIAEEKIPAEQKKEFDKMTSSIPNGGEVKKYLSGDTIKKYEDGAELRNNQEITAQELEPALRHGVETIEKAKEIFGEDYVPKTLEYIKKENINPENKALLYVSLENEMAKRLLAEPDNLGVKKLQDLVRAESQAYLRSNSLAINMGRLRKFAEAGYDVSKLTDQFFSPKEIEQKGQVEKLVQADADTIQRQSEEVGGIDAALEAKIKEGVEKEINKIYDQLPKDKKRGVDKAIEALEKFQKTLRGKTYDATIGIPVAIIDAGVTTIKLALKAGVKIADAIELGINKIKEKYGKEWEKEDAFRKDMAAAFKKEEKNIDPKQFVKDALISQGFGKEVTVTVNKENAEGKTEKVKEKRNVLDWKKLAGEEGSVDKVSENVAKSLAPLGMSEKEISAMAKDFVEEYNDLRASVIEKGLNEIAARNKTVVSPDQKSAAKKLAEMYNYGLFDKNLAEYETVLSKTIGINKLNVERLGKVQELGEAMAKLYSSNFQGTRLNESQLRSAIQVVEDKMRTVLHDEARQHGSTFLKITDVARTYMDLAQRMTLNSAKQALENPLSGRLEKLYSTLGYGGAQTKEMAVQNRKAARQLYKEMVLQKGVGYGNVASTFVNRGGLEMELNKMSDSQIFHGITSTVIGKSTLDAVDSFYKSKITQQKFTYNLMKVLTSDRMVNGKIEKGMSKEDAKKYVAEKITGQSFKDAQTTAKEIIDKINEGQKTKIFNDSPLFIDRLANDIVNAALINGGKITSDMVDASYNAAYKAAGRGLGHVANNFVSDAVGTVSGKIENKINEAIKNKEYNKAAVLQLESIFFRNIANPFVGGGTNWVVLKAEKTGLGLLSGIGSMMRRGEKMDLTTESGMKNLEKAMYENLKIKDKFIRGTVGAATTALSAFLFYGVLNSDEYRKWRNKNKWAQKYTDTITPEAILATMAKDNKDMQRYLENSLNQSDQFDKAKMLMKGVSKLASGKTDEAKGQFGQLVGSTFGAPIPWRLLRDGSQIWAGARGGEPYKVNSTTPKAFWEGYFKAGMVDFMGLAPNSTSSGKKSKKEKKD